MLTERMTLQQNVRPSTSHGVRGALIGDDVCGHLDDGKRKRRWTHLAKTAVSFSAFE